MAVVAGENRDKTADLIAPLPDAQLEADFFQTVRLILRAARKAGHTRAGVGGDALPALEPVRFRAATGMRFPANEITALGSDEADKRELTVAFMGLTGPSGVLPDHYTELVVQRRRARDPALAEFLDLFNHRSIGLFYRAWAKHRLPVRFEESRLPFHDPFSLALASVIGLGFSSQRHQAAQGAGGMLGMAGTLGRKVRSTDAVRRLISTLIDVPVRVDEFQGRWIDIVPGECTRLAKSLPGDRNFAGLGTEAVAGVRVWDVQSRFRVRLGPLSLSEFRSFFELDGPGKLLSRVVREAIGPTMDFDLQLVLKADAVPELKLDDEHAPARLGQTTWIGEPTIRRDRDEAVLSGKALASL